MTRFARMSHDNMQEDGKSRTEALLSLHFRRSQNHDELDQAHRTASEGWRLRTQSKHLLVFVRVV
jgi:hypothetical protein